MQIRLAGGTVPEDTEAELKSAEEEAMERLKNPLKDFPNDIKYFSANECISKIEIGGRFKGKIAKEKIWDKKRMNACLGKHGIVAKRCSMNDTLWARYTKHGDSLTLDIIKQMMKFDAKRRELYPPNYKGTGEEQPPAEYLEELKSSGKLDTIYKEMNELSKCS